MTELQPWKYLETLFPYRSTECSINVAVKKIPDNSQEQRRIPVEVEIRTHDKHRWKTLHDQTGETRLDVEDT